MSENNPISQINANDNNTGNDTDIDGDTVSYTCLYDTVVNGSISSGANCTSLPGTVSFDTSTGGFWTPNYSSSANYEIEITGSEGDLSDGEIFVITVNNNDRAPILATIGDQTVNEAVAIATINANENTTGNDTNEKATIQSHNNVI